MGFSPLIKRFSVILLLVSVSALSVSLAGRSSMVVHKLAKEADHAAYEGTDEAVAIHERLLRMNHGDYGRYTPSPKLSRPRFKLIPN